MWARLYIIYVPYASVHARMGFIPTRPRRTTEKRGEKVEISRDKTI